MCVPHHVAAGKNTGLRLLSAALLPSTQDSPEAPATVPRHKHQLIRQAPERPVRCQSLTGMQPTQSMLHEVVYQQWRVIGGCRASTPGGRMTFRHLYDVIRERWWLVTGAVVLGLMLGGLATLVVPNVYESHVKLFVNVPSLDTVEDLRLGESFAQERATSYTNMVESSAVLEPVTRTLGLDSSPEELADSITATQPPRTAIIDITAEHRNADTAAQIAEGTAQSLIDVAETLEGDVGEGNPMIQLAVMQRAVVPTRPAAPSLTLNMAAGLLVGATAGVSLALRRHNRGATHEDRSYAPPKRSKAPHTPEAVVR